MTRSRFEAAAAAAAAALGPRRTKDLAGLMARGSSQENLLGEFSGPGHPGLILTLRQALQHDGVSAVEAAAYLRGYAAAQIAQRAEEQVSTVWSGPGTPGVPVRSTAQVLIEVLRAARSELLAMTYSARPYAPLKNELASAVNRGVDVHVVVETKAGAARLLTGPEPAAAFADIPGLSLWHWPVEQRRQPSARQHAKLAVADGNVLYLGSANLTESGAHRNIEVGALIRGGPTPQRAAEHIRSLMRDGQLTRLIG